MIWNERKGIGCRILAIRRDKIFSPNSVENDFLILQEVALRLQIKLGTASITMLEESELPTLLQEESGIDQFDVVLSMARSSEALAVLRLMEEKGTLVVNSVDAVERCRRSVLDKLMRDNNVAMPPRDGNQGYWLKRGDASAQEKDDVVFCADSTALEVAKAHFRSRGITEWVVSPHVEGDLLKFYGVGERYFRFFYPSDDHITKFGDEVHNGSAHHYSFSKTKLRSEVIRLSALTGVRIYGGDVVIRADGTMAIIDFNDWPSFFRCRDEAAEAAASEINEMMVMPKTAYSNKLYQNTIKHGYI